MADLTGRVLGDRYRVDAFLGRGGMADVYKVWDQQRAVFLAMKVLHADLAEDQHFLRRFEREAQTLSRLQHPNIVRFYGLEKAAGTQPPLAFMLMDFIDGLTLRKEIFLNKAGLPPERVLEVMTPVCAALYYAHQMGLVHCDIKPSNIMVHRNGTVFLTDFGIARMTTTSGQAPGGMGTPAYMAPEHLHGREPTPAADIYSLGVVLFEMVTGGRRPFTGETLESGSRSSDTTGRIIWEKDHLPVPTPRKFAPSLSPELESIILRCLERQPERRYRSALELLEALQAALSGEEALDDLLTPTGLEDQDTSDLIRLLRAPDGAGSPPAAPLAQLPAGARQESARQESRRARQESARQESARQESARQESARQESRRARQEPAQLLPRALKFWRGRQFWRGRVLARRVPRILGGVAAVLLAALGLSLATRDVHAPDPGAQMTVAGFSVHLPTLGARPQNTPAPVAKDRASSANGPAAGPTVAGITAPAGTLPEPVSLSPTPLGGSEQIAYAFDAGEGVVQVWVMQASQPESHRIITHEAGGACQPAWSPDGQSMAYTTPCRGPSVYYPGATIKVAHLNDSQVETLPLTGGGISAAFDPAWSPDGQTLAYTAIVGEQIRIDAYDFSTRKTRTLAANGIKNAQPAWSPDGEHIAYITSDAQHLYPDALWLMGKNGDSQEVVSNAGPFSSPAWSPDGSKLLVSIHNANNEPVLAVLERANPGLSARRLFDQDMPMMGGAFSPDGQWITFWSGHARDREIYIASTDGKTVRQLTHNKLQDFQPAWSPR